MQQKLVALLEEICRLMELCGESRFKIRAFERAAESISQITDLDELLRDGKITEIPGIGASIAEVLTEFYASGNCVLKEQLIAKLPEGLLEFIKIPGVGPKKARFLIEELGIATIEELHQACWENRVEKLKGFGRKSQEEIINGILYLNSLSGQIRLVEAIRLSEAILFRLNRELNAQRHPAATPLRVVETGELRRRIEVIRELTYLVELPPSQKERERLKEKISQVSEELRQELNALVPIRLFFCETKDFGTWLVKSTGSAEHLRRLSANEDNVESEEKFYRKLKLPYIPPEMRETGEELDLGIKGLLSDVVSICDIKGGFHIHSIWSDGLSGIEELILAAKTLGWNYLGIADHSQSAHYAGGLKFDRVLKQRAEVEMLQGRYPEIKIFLGIESDILSDGSLDYTDEELALFDFVVASVHSGTKVDKRTMTQRMVKAIRNPYTRFIAHPTGRLLLERKEYEVDVEELIRESVKFDVAIEINCNPARLDLDWRWGAKVREFDAKIGINPDAHSAIGLSVINYGVTVARKALIPKKNVINAWSLDEVERWLKRKT